MVIHIPTPVVFAAGEHTIAKVHLAIHRGSSCTPGSPSAGSSANWNVKCDLHCEMPE